MEYNRSNYKRQATGLLKLMAIFLNKLKQIGVFENSLIFIIGDHGPGNYGICEINLRAPGFSWPETPPDAGLLKIKAAALPLMLVKPGGCPGVQPLIVSDAPVSLGDIPITVAAAIGLKTDFPGRPLFSVGAGENRPRRYLYYKDFVCNKLGFMNPMSEYWVRGFSWFDESWQPSGRIFSPTMTK